MCRSVLYRSAIYPFVKDSMAFATQPQTLVTWLISHTILDDRAPIGSDYCKLLLTIIDAAFEIFKTSRVIKICEHISSNTWYARLLKIWFYHCDMKFYVEIYNCHNPHRIIDGIIFNIKSSRDKITLITLFLPMKLWQSCLIRPCKVFRGLSQDKSWGPARLAYFSPNFDYVESNFRNICYYAVAKSIIRKQFWWDSDTFYSYDLRPRNS